MTDRRIERSVSAHIAGLEARVRGLETLIGAGTQAATQRDTILGSPLNATLTTYQDLGGPSVTVDVSRLGILEVYLSADVYVEADAVGGGAYASFELSGANVRAAEDEEALDVWIVGRAAPANWARVSATRTVLVEGLVPGTTTVKMVYRRGGSDTDSASFLNVELRVTPF